MDDIKVMLPDGVTRRKIYSFGNKEDAFKFWIAVLQESIPAHIEMLVYPLLVDFEDDEQASQRLDALFTKYYHPGSEEE